MIEASLPTPAGVDPADWSPAADAVVLYQKADVILLNGAGYAAWVDRVSLPRARLVDTSTAIEARYIPLDGEVTHTHGPGGEHSQTGFASTFSLRRDFVFEPAPGEI